MILTAMVHLAMKTGMMRVEYQHPRRVALQANVGGNTFVTLATISEEEALAFSQMQQQASEVNGQTTSEAPQPAAAPAPARKRPILTLVPN